MLAVWSRCVALLPKPSITVPPPGARLDRPECHGRGFAQHSRDCRFRPIVSSHCGASACTQRRVRWCITPAVCGRTHGGGAGEQLALGTSSAFGSQYVMHRFLGDGAGDWAGKVQSAPDASCDVTPRTHAYPDSNARLQVFPDESDTESNTGINVFEDDEHEVPCQPTCHAACNSLRTATIWWRR